MGTIESFKYTNEEPEFPDLHLGVIMLAVSGQQVRVIAPRKHSDWLEMEAWA